MIEVKTILKRKNTAGGPSVSVRNLASGVDREIYERLQGKLDRAVFDDLFEKVTVSDGVFAIRAKYGFYSEQFISVKGKPVDSGSGSVSGGISEAELEAYLAREGYLRQDSLDGYATQSWVTGKGYAAQSWVNLNFQPRGDYLTSHQTIDHIVPNRSVGDFNAALPFNGLLTYSAGASNAPNDYGAALQWSNVGSPVAGTMQHWITQLASGTDNRLRYRTRTNADDWRAWNTLAFISDIPTSMAWSAITGKPTTWAWSAITGKPTTLSGYGITNAYTKTEVSNQLANYLLRSGGSMTNTNLVANLNAEYLGGLNSVSYARCILNTFVDANDYDSMPGLWGGKVFGGENMPLNYYAFLHFGQGQFYGQFNSQGQALYFRGGHEEEATPGWKRVAFTDSTVAAATRLETARSLWGNSFNGAADVSGSLTGVGNITPTTHNTYDCGSISNNWNAVRTRQLVCNQAHLMWIWQSTANPIAFATNGTERMRLDASGNLSIGSTASMCKLYVAGDIAATGGVSCKGVSTASDSRLKTFIEEIHLSLDDIADAPAWRFLWKDSGEVSAGSVAQYWERLIPETVRKRPDRFKGLEYGTAAMLAVISLAKEVRRLRDELKRRDNATLQR